MYPLNPGACIGNPPGEKPITPAAAGKDDPARCGSLPLRELRRGCAMRSIRAPPTSEIRG